MGFGFSSEFFAGGIAAGWDLHDALRYEKAGAAGSVDGAGFVGTVGTTVSPILENEQQFDAAFVLAGEKAVLSVKHFESASGVGHTLQGFTQRRGGEMLTQLVPDREADGLDELTLKSSGSS